MPPERDTDSTTVDPTTVKRILHKHPVQLGVLCGSQADGIVTPESDVDVAVVFDETLSSDDRHQARIDLIVDLMESLGRNEVDVIDLKSTRPAVGASALRTGMILIGDDEHADQLQEEFDAQTTPRSHAERMRQFDDIIDRLEETT